MWYKGRKAVCITGGTWHWDMEGPPLPGPKKGDILTVRAVGRDKFGETLFFEEWTGPRDEFGACDFRPIDELHEQVDRIEASMKEEPVPVEHDEYES